MGIIVLWLVGAVGSAWLTGSIRRWALRRNQLDLPNERSSHTVPTPRGGGLGFVVCFLVGVGLLAAGGVIEWRVAAAFWVGALVALVGYVDDRRSLSPLTRAVVHLLAALAALVILGGMPPLQIGAAVIEWGVFGHIVGVVGIVWLTNLYNFMDGIDGIAASEAVTVGLLGAVLLAAGGSGLAAAAGLLAACAFGFLWWNFPPARIFMGDVGSGFLGFSFAVLALAGMREGFPVWVWLILLAVFIVDTTVTLARRAVWGKRWYQAHRSHAYQHLTQRLGAHRPVTLGVIALNVAWLGGLALLAYSQPIWTLPAVALAWLPLIMAALVLRAGVE